MPGWAGKPWKKSNSGSAHDRKISLIDQGWKDLHPSLSASRPFDKDRDGFVIAEEDLRIRGPGEITGTSQAGALRLSFADPAVDTALLEVARADAMELLRISSSD